MKYKKSQTGWIIIGIFVPIIVFLYLAYANQWGNRPLTLVPFVVVTALLLLVCSLFYKLTVEIRDSTLRLSYGIGLIHFNFKIDELEGVEIIKTPLYHGLGIRITPHGMLYNIQGSKAVKIQYTRKGKWKSVMIGTAEPEELKKALEKVGK